MKSAEYTVQQLAEIAGCDRESAKKWLRLEGVEPVATKDFGKRGKFKYYDEKALEVVKSHCKRKPATNGEHGDQPNIDPETGLTWAQREVKERARALARANDLADKLKAKEWMSVAEHLRQLSAVISRIEQVPDKAKSELGLADSQGLGLRRMLDEARESAAVEIEE